MAEGAKLRKIREADLKRRDRAKLLELGARIRRTKAERRHAHQQIAHYCRLGRLNLSRRIKALRTEQREQLNAKAAALRAAQREQCAADQDAARLELTRHVGELARDLEAERRSFAHHYGRKTSRTSAAERRAESDDEVERNLPAELVPVFRSVRSQIKATPRKSRTEAFLQWSEENPDAVHAIMYEQAERDVARLVAEHERIAKRLRKRRGAYEDPDEAAHALGAVPF